MLHPLFDTAPWPRYTEEKRGLFSRRLPERSDFMQTIKRLAALLLMGLMLFSCALAAETQTQWTNLGEGENEMTLVLVLPEGVTRGYHISSQRQLMLEALVELELVTIGQHEGETILLTVDGCALPADKPEAYWFLAVYDPALDALTAALDPLEQLPLPGQTYAIGLVEGTAAQ